jgi:hypothetical protein
MSSWKDVHKGAGGGSDLGAVKAVQAHFADNRILMAAITGYDPISESAVPVVKVTIFYELGSVKLCVNSPVDERLGFITLKASDGTLSEAIEAALMGGIEWRKRPKSQPGGSFGGRR